MNPNQPQMELTSQNASSANAASAERQQFVIREIASEALERWNSPQQSHEMDFYRLLRTRLLQHPVRHKTLVVTSACPADGKSTICCNLAGTMAQRHSRVALVDCDLRRSRLGDLLGVKTSLGLTSLQDGAEPEEILFTAAGLPNLSVALAGPPVASPVDFIDSDLFAGFLRYLRQQFDYIILDSPPILSLADFPILEKLCDATAFVVRPGFSNRSAINEALQTLNPEKFTGVVVNQNIDWWLWKSTSYGGYYGYYSRNESPNKSIS